MALKLMNLNVWSLTGRTVWKGLRGVLLLEELCHWNRFEGFESPCHSQLVHSAFCL